MDEQDFLRYYSKNHEKRVFRIRLSDLNELCYIMYVYDYDKELENFKKTFLYYLPFYIRNSDQLSSIDVTDNIDWELKKRSIKIRKDITIVAQRDSKINGIYGELFMDFYLRVVENRRLMITYAQKRAYKSNYESQGTDSVTYYIENNNICICFSEAKFVAGASNAKNGLCEDIEGNEEKPSHLSKNYLNDYIRFIIDKGPILNHSDMDMYRSFIKRLNKRLDVDDDFLSFLIEENVCFHFMFFAIFDSKKRKPECLKSYYNEIYNEAKNHISTLGVKNYKIEIVFIPVENSPILIKKGIDENYE